jgi:hypothetical protein
MPPKPPQSNPAALLVDGLRVVVERNHREAEAIGEALHAAIRNQRKAVELLAEAVGETTGQMLAEARAELAKLRAEIADLRREVLRDAQRPHPKLIGRAHAA